MQLLYIKDLMYRFHEKIYYHYENFFAFMFLDSRQGIYRIAFTNAYQKCHELCYNNGGIIYYKDDKNKICKHAKINRHLEFAAADFYM